MNVYTHLAILILDEKTFHYKILSLSNSSVELISSKIDSFQDISATLQNQLSVYTVNYKDISRKPKLSDVVVDEDAHVYYYCMVPFDPKIKDAYLLEIENYENIPPNLRTIIQAIC